MTKSELIDAVAHRADVAKSTAEKVVNCVFDSMIASLERGDDIEIRGFGRFSVRQYGWYMGRNPKTNEPVPVPPKRLPYFKPGKDLKELVDAEPGAPGAPLEAALGASGEAPAASANRRTGLGGSENPGR